MIWAIVAAYLIIAALSVYFGLRWLAKNDTYGGYEDTAPLIVLWASVWPVMGIAMGSRWMFLKLFEVIWEKYGKDDEAW